MDKLQTYYRRATRHNSTVEEMKEAILASLHHCFSTDATPRHDFCPSGRDSWCFFKSAHATGEPPGPHASRMKTQLDHALLHEHLQPIYNRLSDNELLSRCLRHATQNANESLRCVIWSKCSKTKFASSKKVRFSMLLAIAEYNHCPEGSLHLKEL
ncbi:hypothetical protein PoB_004650400 [Plakobranchus ocellatus]|uniref:Uncharacterized protein n=1 Tax=Plakobranchus ocellatus TaxID=259542 RepID=A0AAV4BIR4_9GAST|nr:hypothetical protein PoB_004650400 [Plakobranchus ocellatus]